MQRPLRRSSALRRVGAHRKGEVLRFLHEAGLIYKGNAIVDLRGADLSGADLSNIKLSGTELSGIDFSNANLNTTLLDGANLKGANLTGASYTAQQLSKAFIQ